MVFAATSPVSARRPNIVFILADDVGREVLGCYGGTSYQTPNIDRLAAGGMRFQHSYTMPVCYPSRITLLTGQYPFRLSNPDWGTFPRETEGRTLPALLKRAGYATAVGGKWQLALLKDDLEQPYRMGFDEYCLYGWHEGPWYYEPHIWHDAKLRTDVRRRYGPDVICDFIVDFIQRHKSQPFFAFYSMSLCHAETNDLDKPAPVGPHGRYDSYAEMVTKMDDCVGRVVRTLDDLGIRRETLVIYTSDNGTAGHNLMGVEDGELVYEPVVSRIGGREIPGGKATLTDWGTRIPFLANWPGTIDVSETRDELTDVSDILPSILDVVGSPLPPNTRIDGRSIAAVVRGDQPERDWVFAEHKGRCFVRSKRWKLYNDGRFYDMTDDPEEKKAMASDSLSAEANTAFQELQQALQNLEDSAPPAKTD